MPPSVVLGLALRLLSDAGVAIGTPVQLVAPGDFPAIQARIAPLRAFRRRIDGVLDPVIYVLRTTEMFERAATGHTPSVALVASSIFHEQLHGTDEALDESSVLMQEGAFLQRHISRTVLRLSTAHRRFLERHVDQLRSRARQIVPAVHVARGWSSPDVLQ